MRKRRLTPREPSKSELVARALVKIHGAILKEWPETLCAALYEPNEGEWSIDDFRGMYRPHFPRLNPDAYLIYRKQKRFTWIEVDDQHPTPAEKRLELGNFADILWSDFSWDLHLVIYRLEPFPTKYEYSTEALFGWEVPSISRSDMIARLLGEAPSDKTTIWTRNDLAKARHAIAGLNGPADNNVGP